MPASDGWDNDGVAPRDFLVSLVETFTPGRYATYPPVHLALLGLVTLPITTVGLLRAPSMATADIVGEMIKVPYMTAIAYVARAISLVMSLGVVLFVARIAEELRARELGAHADDIRVRRAGYATAAFAGINATATYYAHTSNLDIPYLFWASWSVLCFVRALTREQPRLLRRAFVFAVLAIGTKDQAYAMFALAFPVALAAWAVFDPWARANIKRVLREVSVATALAVLVYAVASGAVFNPTGFRARVAFLTGPASQDYVQYTGDWTGRLRVLSDAGRFFDRYYPYSASLLIVLGLALVVRRSRACRREGRGGSLVAGVVPLLVSVSFTVAFNWVARRTDHRFLLPQSMLLAVYGGAGVDALVFASSRRLRIVSQALVSLVFAGGIFACAAIDANLLFDPRYEVEEWLRAHARPGDVVEIYGGNVYQPRVPPEARVQRVGPEPVGHRSVMPGVVELEQPFSKVAERAPRFVVVSDGWIWRYLLDPRFEQGGGLALPKVHERTMRDDEARTYFLQLTGGELGYELGLEASFRKGIFPLFEVHSSTGRTVKVYVRR